MQLFPDDDQLCYEPGDPAFQQMAHHEIAHGVASRLVGVGVAEFKVSQWVKRDKLDRLFGGGGCSYCK